MRFEKLSNRRLSAKTDSNRHKKKKHFRRNSPKGQSFYFWICETGLSCCVRQIPKESCISFQVGASRTRWKLLMVTLNLPTEDRMVKFGLVTDTNELQSLRWTGTITTMTWIRGPRFLGHGPLPVGNSIFVSGIPSPPSGPQIQKVWRLLTWMTENLHKDICVLLLLLSAGTRSLARSW